METGNVSISTFIIFGTYCTASTWLSSAALSAVVAGGLVAASGQSQTREAPTHRCQPGPRPHPPLSGILQQLQSPARSQAARHSKAPPEEPASGGSAPSSSSHHRRGPNQLAGAQAAATHSPRGPSKPTLPRTSRVSRKARTP